MNHPNVKTAEWYGAIALTERIASLRSTQNKSINIEINSDLAQRRIERWKSQPPFDKDSYFRQRLDTENISEEEFLLILGEPIEAVRDRFSNPPTWLAELAQAFARTPAFETTTFLEAFKDIKTIGFLEIIEPLVS